MFCAINSSTAELAVSGAGLRGDRLEDHQQHRTLTSPPQLGVALDTAGRAGQRRAINSVPASIVTSMMPRTTSRC